VTDYVLSTNARVFAMILKGFVAWNKGSGEAEMLSRMIVGDHIVPKFAQTAVYGDQDESAQRALAGDIGIDFDSLVADYDALVESGKGAIPFILTVKHVAREVLMGSVPQLRVDVEVVRLEHPLSTQEFLRLRAIPDFVAAQFKGTVGRGRHIQEVDSPLSAAVVTASLTPDPSAHLRQFSLVEAQTAEAALAELRGAGRSVSPGDSAFLVTRAMMPGVATVDAAGRLVLEHEVIAQTPESVRALLEDAQRRASPRDPFAPAPAFAAIDELIGLLDGGTKVLEIDDYARFYDRYRLLSRKVSQALVLAKKPLPADFPIDSSETARESEDTESDDATSLAGLTVEAVEACLPSGFSIDRSTLAAAVTALRAGKHLLIGGPPGTGKTTLAEALSEAVVGSRYTVTTATADWTTFDTIGGYLPVESGIRFEPGVVLRALRGGSWLLIDELNRADIDRAFGPLFTVLSGSEESGRKSVLPFAEEGQAVTVEWAVSRLTAESAYPLTPSWRLIGTLNLSDKSSLFRLSFAFLRRFAVIDVPLPHIDAYKTLLEAWFQDASPNEISALTECALQVVYGPIPIGPAIAKDIAEFVLQGTAPTANGTSAFPTAQEAMVTAIRLLVVPQYEGSEPSLGRSLAQIVRSTLSVASAESHEYLASALAEVALS
jgi:energy-coupling factor transporter ATP-binding protein EcfA2